MVKAAGPEMQTGSRSVCFHQIDRMPGLWPPPLLGQLYVLDPLWMTSSQTCVLGEHFVLHSPVSAHWGLAHITKGTSVQFNSVTRSCLTLWDPMNHSTPGLPVHHQLPESTQIHFHWVGDAIQPSYPLSSPPPALNLSQHQGLFQWVSSLHQVAKVLEFQLQHQSFQWTPKDTYRPPNAMCLSLGCVTLFSASSGPCFCFQLPFDYENLENWDSTSFWVLSLSRARHSAPYKSHSLEQSNNSWCAF